MNENDIGFGIFCFGDDYYYEGAYKKIKQIIGYGYKCYVLTEAPENFQTFGTLVKIIPYYRAYKSYHDKMIIPRHILKEHQFCILMDADLEITDYSFLEGLRHFKFKRGISYVDVLFNHPERKECVHELNLTSDEWRMYSEYCEELYPQFKNLVLIWEYLLIINREGLNFDFFKYYDRLQIKKESCFLKSEKDVNAPGEGISITLSAVLSKTNIQRDLELYEITKNNLKSTSKKFTNDNQ